MTTFRGHTEAVTSLSVASMDDYCFSGSMDSTVKVWNIPPLNKPPYSTYGLLP